MNRYLLTGLIWVLFVANVLAQSGLGLKFHKPVYHYALSQWTTESGLSSNNINHVAQSNDGYIWISSFNGLLRFDGIAFEQYNIDNISFLNSNGFYGMYQSRSGALYFSTQASGVVLYENNKFSPYVNTEEITPAVRSMFEDSKGMIWIGSNNNGLFLVENDTIRRVSHQLLDNETIFAITEGAAGEIIVGTGTKGIVIIENEVFTSIRVTNGLISDLVKCFKWVEEELLIGTVGGISSLKSGKIEDYPYMVGTEINSIEDDKNGDLWFATELGLGRVEENNFEFFSEDEGLPSRQISSLMFDTEDNLWISTKKSGLLRLKYSNFTNITEDDGLSLNRVNVIIEDGKGNYLVGTDNGSVDLIEKDRIKHVALQSQLNNVSVKDMLIDQEGALWVATYAGVIKKTSSREILYNIKDGLSDIQARVLHEDRDGSIWVGYKNGGLVKIDGEKITTLDRSDNLGSNYILSIDELDDGTILVGTHSGGLNFIREDKVVNVRYPLNLGDGVLIFNTYVENEDRVWLATNIGLFLYQTSTLEFSQISEVDGLMAETLFDLTEDKLGYFWISSNVGIIRVAKEQLLDFINGNIKNVEAIKYDHNDGLISNECTAAAKSLTNSSGEIWFPTLGGIATVDPTSLTKNEFIPPVYIKSFCLDNECRQELLLNTKVSPGNQRYVIDFTALSFTAPAKVKFQYQLEGFDPDWIETIEEREAVYTNLKPGKYTFKVKASNNDGVWNTKGASFEFVVKPYFYKTPWFYIAIVLVFGGLISIRIYTIRRHNMRLQKLNTELDSFVYSTSHDLRAPLMSILGLVNIAKLDKDPTRLKGYLEKIENSVKKLDSFISDIIDYSRNSRLELILQKVDVKQTIDEVLQSLSYLDAEDRISKRIKIDTNVKSITSDQRRLKIILSNIVSNCYRYHRIDQAGPYIDISVGRKKSEIIFKISDNGQGIEKMHITKVFDMFYRASEDSKGSGLGLYIVKETIDKLGGTIQVESTIEEGTIFFVRFPESVET